MTYVAVDVDGTLVRSNVSFLFGKVLYKKGMLSFFQALWFTLLYMLHYFGLLSLKRLHLWIFSSLFKNKPFSIFDDVAREYFHARHYLFRSEVLEEIVKRQKAGERVVLVSASPDFLVRRIAQLLDVPESYGSTYLVDEKGNFSELGRVMTGEEKAFMVSRACADTKDRIVAITDSAEDVPLLALADEACVVAPRRSLRRRAQREGWRIVL